MPDDEIKELKPPIDIERIGRDVEALQNAMDALAKSGIDEEVMIAFLHYKTKLSIKQIKTLLKGERELFRKLRWMR